MDPLPSRSPSRKRWSMDVDSSMYDYGADFLVTTSVANSMNPVRMAEFACLTIACLLHVLLPGLDGFDREYIWLKWLSLVSAVGCFLVMTSWRTYFPINLTALTGWIFSLSACVLLTRSAYVVFALDGALPLFLLTETLVFAALSLFCAFADREFSFRASFLAASVASAGMVAVAYAVSANPSWPLAVLVIAVSSVVAGYILASVAVQCEELCPQAYDIAIVGLNSSIRPTAVFLMGFLVRKETSSLSRSVSLVRYGSA